MVGDAFSNEPGRAALSVREQQVLELAALGLTNSKVAERLDLSVHAIKFHLASAYRKLGVSNRTQAVVVYLQDRPDTMTGAV